MIVTFEEDYLKSLYTDGCCNDKKHRYQPEIIKRYKRCVDYLKAASRKEDLFLINSLNFEALQGNKKGRFSIRVNDKYRIEFTLSETIEKSILTICNIVELSNHYK
ncbi:MAG: type II toxin-antitoxin system RelE/ParE family toxin [Muribaculaceae bacterium]|nr:type II toxin-antitoxin system RelE/ParE family toxin [Muribaculaceae bacterium]